jgi:glycolate oxidase
LLRFDGGAKDEIEAAYSKTAQICIDNGALDVFIMDTEERSDSVWKARGAFLEAIKSSTTDMDEADVVTPRSKVDEMVAFTHSLRSKYGIRIKTFGHAGDGNLHAYILKDDLSEDEWRAKLDAVMEAIYEKARALNGQVSGEHGIGYIKRGYLKKSLDPAAIALMKGIKAVFDPKNILNPDKVL